MVLYNCYGDSMKLDIVKTGYLRENCYILDKNSNVLVIDPGADFEKIRSVIDKRKVVGVLITHSHFDHIGALDELRKYYSTCVYSYNNLNEGVHSIQDFTFEVIYTPGHSKDSVSYYFFEDKKMFVGDFIFKNDIGRCDLPTGNVEDMINSIAHIKTYEECKIYPGHGDDTTLDSERKSNKYFN